MKARSMFVIPLAVLVGGGAGGGAIAPAGPCDEPLDWRIAELDGAFGLGADEAGSAVREAAALWEEAAGRPLFREHAERGFPIRFIHDGRHAAARERSERMREIDALAEEIEEERAALEELKEEVEEERAEHEERVRELDERLDRHQAAVARWNRRGGAPDEEYRRLRRIGEELEREERELEARGEKLRARVARVNDETRRLNRKVDRHNGEKAEFRNAFPAAAGQSSHYREARRTLGPWDLSIEREIQVFQFDDRDHLRLLLAHELGHALGLSHSGEPGAIMFLNAGQRRPGPDGVRLHPRDIEQLLRQCET